MFKKVNMRNKRTLNTHIKVSKKTIGNESDIRIYTESPREVLNKKEWSKGVGDKINRVHEDQQCQVRMHIWKRSHSQLPTKSLRSLHLGTNLASNNKSTNEENNKTLLKDVKHHLNDMHIMFTDGKTQSQRCQFSSDKSIHSTQWQSKAPHGMWQTDHKSHM